MKKYLSGIFAIILAVGFSAFTAKSDVHSADQKYFKYLDYPNDANIGVASRYELSADLGCTVGDHRCAVIAESDGGSPERPVLTDPNIVIKEKN